LGPHARIAYPSYRCLQESRRIHDASAYRDCLGMELRCTTISTRSSTACRMVHPLGPSRQHGECPLVRPLSANGQIPTRITVQERDAVKGLGTTHPGNVPLPRQLREQEPAAPGRLLITQFWFRSKPGNSPGLIAGPGLMSGGGLSFSPFASRVCIGDFPIGRSIGGAKFSVVSRRAMAHQPARPADAVRRLLLSHTVGVQRR
jgi:hypothetical protein